MDIPCVIQDLSCAIPITKEDRKVCICVTDPSRKNIHPSRVHHNCNHGELKQKPECEICVLIELMLNIVFFVFYYRWAAGYSFSRGHFVVNVPYDPYQPMIFQGEEMSIGACLQSFKRRAHFVTLILTYR